MNHQAALFNQTLEMTIGHGIGLPAWEVVAVVQQQVKQGVGVARIVLGAGRGEGLAIAGGGRGVNGK